MKKIKLFQWAAVLAFCALLLSAVNAQAVTDEARRYMARGEAAEEIAKSPEDYEQAIKEFQAAAGIASDWAEPYYRLGLVQEKAGKIKEAITSLKRYVQLAPNAPDAAKVKDLIYKLEYKAEQEITQEEALDILGSLSDTAKWDFRGDGSGYKNWIRGFRREGTRIAITYICNIHNQNNNCIEYAEIIGKTNKLKLQLYFSDFYWPCRNDVIHCDGAMGALGQYELEIVSRQKILVKSVESYPKIQYMDAQVYKKSFEYIRK